MKLNDPKFWTLSPKLEGVVLTDDSFQYVILDHSYQMVPIVRTAEELFVDTIRREGAKMKVVVNGSYYDVTNSGLADATWGHDPVAAAETTILGQVVKSGKLVTGTTQPKRFYFAQKLIYGPPPPNKPMWGYIADFGDPPISGDILCAFGGLGPMVVGALKYGVGNVYRPGKTGPATGDPGAGLMPDLVQRNNENFKSADSRPAATGKTVLASSWLKGKLLVGVQPHGAAPGQTYSYLAESLLRTGFEHAVFLDGSDSATFMVDGKMIVTPGEDKDETNILGVGFKL